MRPSVTLLVVLALACMRGNASATDAPTQTARDVAVQRVLEAEDAYVAAEVARDEAELRRLIDDRFLYNSADGSTSGKEDLIETVMSLNMVDQRVSERSVSLEGSVATIYGTAALSFQNPESEEEPTVHTYRYTSIYVDRAGEWRMLGLQMQKYDSSPSNSEQSSTPQEEQSRRSNMPVHYVEFVTTDVEAQCLLLQKAHGLSFGDAVADMGGARIAEASDGSLVGVRAPLAAHEEPIVRTYFMVDDIERSVQEAESAGAVIAYPPTAQGETGIWAIYIAGGVQVGLWQSK